MNTTRRTRPRIPRFIPALLIASYALTGASLGMVHHYRDIADEAAQLARESIYEAHSSLNLAERYKMQNEHLLAQNQRLLDILSTYGYETDIVDNPTPPRYFNVAMDEELQSFIWMMCCEYGIADYYELIFAVIQHESKFDAAAISQTNDYGLMQINECNHQRLREQLGIVDFLDPYDNVHGGIYMLASLLHKYDMQDALMAYNMGENGAAKLWRRGIHSTTYTDQVLDYYKQFTENI